MKDEFSFGMRVERERKRDMNFWTNLKFYGFCKKKKRYRLLIEFMLIKLELWMFDVDVNGTWFVWIKLKLWFFDKI